MKSVFTILFSVVTVLLLAQPSTDTFPDFTETDIEGNEHQLYADYLNQGKTVVIDIFATWCPNCVNSLPGLHALEEEYGEDLIFLSFERDSSTSNEAEWAEDNGVTNAIFANSIETMGTWNTQYQPNFFVICPDGSFELKQGSIGSSPEPLNEYIDACPAVITDNVEEISKIEFSIISNPVENKLGFTTNISNGSYTIVNLTGQEVMNGTFEEKSTEIDASSLETGLYFLKVEAGNSSSVKKFIKN